MRRLLKRHGLAGAILLGFSVILFWEAIIGRVVLIGEDGGALHAPWLDYTRACWQTGQFPFWDPFTFSGYPFASNLQTGLYYPFRLLCLVLSSQTFITWWEIFHFALAGYAMYAWAWWWFRRQDSALVSALAYGAGSFITAHIDGGQIGHVGNLAWLPLVGLAADQFIHRPSWRGSLWLGLTMAVCLLPGHPQFPYYMAILVAAMAVWASVNDGRWLGRFSGLAVAGVITAGLLAVVLIPFADLSRHTAGRAGGMSLWEATFDTLPPVHVLTALAPFVFGYPHDGLPLIDTPGSGYYEITLYLGLLPLLLAITAILHYPNRWKLGWLLAITLSLLLAMGLHTPLYKLMFDWFPGWNRFRSIGRLRMVWFLGMALLAGAGWNDTFHRKSAKAFRLLVSLSIAFGAMVFGVVLTIPTCPKWWLQIIKQIYVCAVLFKTRSEGSFFRQHEVLAGIPEDFFTNRLDLFHWELLQAGLLICGILTCLILFVRRGGGNRPVFFYRWRWLLIALFVIDLGWSTRLMLPATSAQTYEDQFFPNSDLVQWLETRPQTERLLACIAFDQPQICVHPELLPCRPLHYQWYDTRGYTGVVISAYGDYINRMIGSPAGSNHAGRLVIPHRDLINEYLLNLLNVGLILSFDELDHPCLFTSSKGLHVYANKGVFPRAFLSQDHPDEPQPDPSLGVAAIERISPNEAIMSATAIQPALLVYSEVNFPGWRVFVDGRAAPVVTVAGALKGVRVASGVHAIRFAFRPRFYWLAAAISVVSWIAVVALLTRRRVLYHGADNPIH